MSAASPLPPVPDTLGLNAVEAAVVIGTNAERARVGLSALMPDMRLRAAARGHTQDMAQRDFFAHQSTRPGFETPQRRIGRAGATDAMTAENIGYVYDPPTTAGMALVRGWMDSPPHRANMLTTGFTHIGVGAARREDGRVFGVQVFSGRLVELALELTRRSIRLDELHLSGSLDASSEAGLFVNGRWAGQPPQAGRFAFRLPFEPSAEVGLGWRPRGSGESFLLQAGARLPAAIGPGPLAARVDPGAPFVGLEARLTSEFQDSYILGLGFSRPQGEVRLLERGPSGEAWSAPLVGRREVVCPVGGPGKSFMVVVGQTVAHQFALDGRTGRVEAGGEDR